MCQRLEPEKTAGPDTAVSHIRRARCVVADTCRDPDGTAESTPHYGTALNRWFRELWTLCPELGPGPEPDRILVIFGAARRHHTATVRTLTFGGRPTSWISGRHRKPVVRRSGRFQFFEIALRPRFFRCLEPRQRLRVLLHELWHLGPDGTLAPERRHGRFHAPAHRDQLDRWVEEVPPPGQLLEPGWRRIDAWLHRPPARIPRDRAGRPGYRIAHDERDLYEQVVEQL